MRRNQNCTAPESQPVAEPISVAEQSNLYPNPPANVNRGSNSPEGSLSSPPASLAEDLADDTIETWTEPQDNLDKELEWELAKENQLIKEEKLQEVCLRNAEWERWWLEGTTGTTPEIGGDEDDQAQQPSHQQGHTIISTPWQAERTAYTPSGGYLSEKPAAELKHGPQIHKWYSGTTVKERESFLNQLDIYFKKYKQYFS